MTIEPQSPPKRGPGRPKGTGAKTLTPTQIKMASNRRRREVTEETYTDQLTEETGTGVKITHTSNGKTRLYFPSDYGWMPRDIPTQNWQRCLDDGAMAFCPDCKGECEPGINACPGKPARMMRICPIPSCRKRIPDPQSNLVNEKDADNAKDPHVIQDDAYADSTPETRTQAVLDAHMAAFHKQEFTAATRSRENRLLAARGV